jgi:hypothetical protein
MNIYILTYPGGGCGNFINYFINRHRSFPNPTHIGQLVHGNEQLLLWSSSRHFKNIVMIADHKYVHNNHDNVMTSLNKIYTDQSATNRTRIDYVLQQHPKRYNSNEPISTWFNEYKKIPMDSIDQKRKQIFLNEEFSAFVFIPRPSHGVEFFIHHPHYISQGSMYDCKHITVDVDFKLNRIRWSASSMIAHRQIPQLKDSLHVPLHVINLLKLIECDTNEYNKLLDFIEQPPLDNWKELITDYRTAINY